MFRKIIGVILTASVLFVFSQASVLAGNPLEKLARGCTNIVTSPGELVYQINPAMKSTPDPVTGSFLALFRGIFFTIKRAGVGLYDVVTFPIPKPANYAPVYEPETLVKQVFKGSFFSDDPTSPIDGA